MYVPANTVEPCEDIAGIDFGLCDAILGFARINGYCTEISGCGTTIGPVNYSPAFYTSLEECVVSCNEGCISQEYLDMGPMIDCAPEISQVCGCNGNTYDNACIAQYFGGNVNWTASSKRSFAVMQPRTPKIESMFCAPTAHLVQITGHSG